MYNHFFKLNKESEAISNISRNLSKYSYNNEAKYDLSYITDPVTKHIFRKAINIGQNGGKIDNIGKNYHIDDFIVNKFNSSIKDYFESNYHIKLDFDNYSINDLRNGLFKPDVIIQHLNKNGNIFDKAEIDKISKFLLEKYHDAIKKSIENNDNHINRYIDSTLAPLINDIANTHDAKKIKHVIDAINIIYKHKAMRILISNPKNYDSSKAYKLAKSETSSILGTILRRKNINISRDDLADILGDTGKSNNSARIKEDLADFNKDIKNIYGVDSKPEYTPTIDHNSGNVQAGLGPKATRYDEDAARNAQSSKQHNKKNKDKKNKGDESDETNKKDDNEGIKKISGLSRSAENVLTAIAGTIAAISGGALVYSKVTEK